ncbi:MAG: SH3 domain-containing protein [Chloroflexota bacterium]
MTVHQFVRGAWAALLAMALASCTLGVPQVPVTPTLGPTNTPTQIPPTRIVIEPTDVPLPTLGPTDTPSSTPTETATSTATDTPTDRPTPTNTRTDAPTATNTFTATATATNTATETATFTPPPSVTPLPTIPPTVTPLPPPTQPPLPTITSSPTFVPLPPATVTPVVLASPTATRTLSPEEIEAFTPENNLLFATPTFITLEAPTEPPVFSTVPPTVAQPPQPTGIPQLPTVAIFPSPTPALPPTVDPASVVIPPTVSVLEAPQALPTLLPQPASVDSLLDFTIGPAVSVPVDPAVVNTGGIDNVQLYAQNPANPDEFTVVNPVGQIYFGNSSGLDRTGGREPFTEFHYQINNRADNNAPVTAIEYADSGRLAFIIEGDSINVDGVWTLADGRFPFQLLRDCPRENHPGCMTVLSEGRDVFRWVSREVKWQPGSDPQSLIVVMDLPDEGRRGIAVVFIPNRDPQRLPPFYRYDSANWSPDGTSIIVSGLDPSRNPVIARLDPQTREVTPILDANRVGLFPRDAIELPNGLILAFASNVPGGVVRLIDAGGNVRSGDVGTAPPRSITWNRNSGQAFVTTTNGQSFIVTSGGTTFNASGGLVSAPVSNPAPAQPVTNANIPTGVVEGSQYAAGQQVRIRNGAGLNMRVRPSTGTDVVTTLDNGVFVVVVAGPVNDGQFTWWQVQSANGLRGWVAGTIEGRDTIGP